MKGGETCSIWPNEGAMQCQATKGALKCLSRMLDDGLHTDVTINTANGSVRAHRVVLAARSPVFESMFLHDLKEKESSIINIEDISVEACMALLRYIYIRMNSKMITNENEGSLIYPRRGALNQ
jgi:speckle-type POZ protein